MFEGQLSLPKDDHDLLMDNGPAVKYELEQIRDKFQQKNNDRSRSRSRSRNRIKDIKIKKRKKRKE